MNDQSDVDIHRHCEDTEQQALCAVVSVSADVFADRCLRSCWLSLGNLHLDIKSMNNLWRCSCLCQLCDFPGFHARSGQSRAGSLIYVVGEEEQMVEIKSLGEWSWLCQTNNKTMDHVSDCLLLLYLISHCNTHPLYSRLFIIVYWLFSFLSSIAVGITWNLDVLLHLYSC